MTVGEVSTMSSRRRYRVVLTGELMPGHAVDSVLPTLAKLFQTATVDLRQVFDGGQHPIDRAFSGDDALEMQERLERIGVRARVERIAERELNLVLRTDAPGPGSGTIERVASLDLPRASGPSVLHEPAISYAAAPSDNKQPQSLSHAETHWRKAWGDFHEDLEPDEPDRRALFVGPGNPYYMAVFERFRKSDHPGFVFSWNWAAVPSPFLWALHRKLWLWALLIGITEVVLPVILLFFGLNDIVSDKLVYIAYMGVIGNRLFWPALLNHLYFRHVEGMLLRLHDMVAYVADTDVASSGGVSKSAVFVGLAFSGVLILFVWSFIDSLQGPNQLVENRLATLPDRADLVELQGSRSLGAGTEEVRKEENRWVVTRSKLRTLGQAVNQWMTHKAASGGPTQLNLFKLREDMDLSQESLQDGWSNDVQYIPDNEGYRLISAGPDKLFGTADDIQYRRVLNQ